MRLKNFLLIASLLPSVLLAQELDRYNALSYSTAPLRPVLGILDLNVAIPTKPTQALITGIHHYSYLYDYTRPDEAAELSFLQSHTEGEYTEWIMSNVIALDYRFYWMKTKRNGRKVARYFTVLNRLPVIKWNYSTDIQLNPEYTDWYDQNYDPNDPEWDDGPFNSAPTKFVPKEYENLNTRFTFPYRVGFEYGRKRMSVNPEKRLYNELGVAVIFGRSGSLPYGLPLLTWRLGFNHH